MSLESYSVSARPGLEVELQGATAAGEAKDSGVSYADPADDGVYGPYETGCEDGRKCYEISLQREQTGLQVTLRLQGQVPMSGLVGWWRVEALDCADGDEVETWAASLGDYPLTSLTSVPPKFRTDRVNGLPSLRSVADDFEGVGMAMQTGYVFAGSGEGRQLVLVCKISAYAYGHIEMMGQVYHSGLEFDGWTSGSFSGVNVAGDLSTGYYNDAVAERPSEWCIVSVRYALSRSKFSLRANGEELNEQLELAGTASLTRSNEDMFYVHCGIEYGEHLEIAEMLAWDRGLDDDEIERVEAYLSEKYAIDLAETS